jgi:hypothetical protein
MITLGTGIIRIKKAHCIECPSRVRVGVNFDDLIHISPQIDSLNWAPNPKLVGQLYINLHAPGISCFNNPPVPQNSNLTTEDGPCSEMPRVV